MTTETKTNWQDKIRHLKSEIHKQQVCQQKIEEVIEKKDHPFNYGMIEGLKMALRIIEA